MSEVSLYFDQSCVKKTMLALLSWYCVVTVIRDSEREAAREREKETRLERNKGTKRKVY